ncbi:angiopoietin-2-like [Musca vetustissima]|uniref:angiopoietin-2-like n=1 Tax=Musca vetustissima TaxID=27455 RepID=UPI002AB72FDF|nr:angiopoietin-2-like [Musca vetustissima]
MKIKAILLFVLIVLQILIGNKADDNVVASTVSTLLKNDTTTATNDDTAIPENTTIISDDDTTTTEEYYNPYEDEQQLFLWSDLFLKVNDLLVESKNMNSETKKMYNETKEMHSEMNKLNTNLLDVTQKIDDLTKRQGELEGNVAKIVEQQMSSMNVTLMERQEELEGNMAKIVEQQMSSMNVTLMERQEELEGNVAKIVEQQMSSMNVTLMERQEEQEGNVAKIVQQQMSSMNVTLMERIDDLTQRKHIETLRNWTTIVRRMNGYVNFTRNWRAYKEGFGNPPHGEFFIGLDKLHELTTAVPNIELKVILRDSYGVERYALYDGFNIGNEAEKYQLKVLGKYSGTAGDSLEYQKGMKFSTFDEDNDKIDYDDNIVASTVSTLLKNDTTMVSKDDTTIPENTTIISDEDTTTSEEYYNPYEDEYQLLLWKNLFLKVNDLLVESKNMNNETMEMHSETKEMHSEMTRMNSEINKLNSNRLDVTQKIDELAKRQEELEGNMANIAQQISSMKVTLMERQRQQEIDVKNILQIVSNVSATMNEEVRRRKNLDTLRNWTTIARRMDGSVDFYRGWNEYKVGFGNPPHIEFFIGLDRLHELTTAVPNIELKVILRDWEGEERYALYDGFQIGNEAEKYELKVLGKYSGTAGDSLAYHKGMKFTTFDEDNDNANSNCAKVWKGAWWFGNCSYSRLFGPYRKGENINSDGIAWFHWKNTYQYSFKYVEMLIRAKPA